MQSPHPSVVRFHKWQKTKPKRVGWSEFCCEAAKKAAAPAPASSPPTVGSERSRRVGSVSTSTDKAAAVERTVSKAALVQRL
eukprot:7357694-Prymnesium_polylepis.1